MPSHQPLRMSAITRRRFIYYSALATGATALTGHARAQPRRVSPNAKLNIGCVGCGGKGSSDIHWCSSENIVALCDVSQTALDRQRQNHPDAKVYKDFRQMLEKEKSLDAIDIATPDHMHAAIAAMAIKMGKHVYCQKPLTMMSMKRECCVTWPGNTKSPRKWEIKAAPPTVCGGRSRWFRQA